MTGLNERTASQLLPGGDSVLFTAATTRLLSTRWDTAAIVVQSIASGRRTVVVQGGSYARYVPTGHLVYALGDSLPSRTLPTRISGSTTSPARSRRA